MKISRKYYTVLFGSLVSIAMSFFMSLVLTTINVGLGPNFWEIWLIAFTVSFLVGLPISLIIIPIVRKIVDKLTVD